jgi:hypothetical protein
MTRYLLLFDSYSFVIVGRPLWREDGSYSYSSQLSLCSRGTDHIENLFYSCRDVLQRNCLATSLDVYCYSIGLPIVACWNMFMESLPSNDDIHFCYYSDF